MARDEAILAHQDKIEKEVCIKFVHLIFTVLPCLQIMTNYIYFMGQVFDNISCICCC